MAVSPHHTSWLIQSKDQISTTDGIDIKIFELIIDQNDSKVLSSWAKHFREHYCLDSQIDAYRDGTGKSRTEYLRDLVFPDRTKDFGPSIRAGDFAEILVADLLEYLWGYWVPRTRYRKKQTRNESPKGTDILGFRILSQDPEVPSEQDILITFEVKAQLINKLSPYGLQSAVNDSSKDYLRLSEALNATKQRLVESHDIVGVKRIKRFQDGISTRYIRQSGAAAVFSSQTYDCTKLGETDCSSHENKSNLNLIVIYASDIMRFIHQLYERAADEA